MKHSVTLIPGDGIGPEVVEAARRVLEATGVEFHWEVVNAGASALEKEGSLLPDRLFRSIKKNRIALKGPTTTPIGYLQDITAVGILFRTAKPLG